MKPPASLPYEEAAEKRTVELWVCKTCDHGYRADDQGEHLARFCCAASLPCVTGGCTGRRERPYTVCSGCREKSEAARWEERLADAKPWDGVSPLWSGDGRKFHTADEVHDGALDELADEDDEEGHHPGVDLTSLRLVHATADDGPRRELAELWEGHLPDDYDEIPDEGVLAVVQKAWDAYIDGCLPLTWHASSTPVLLDAKGQIVIEKAAPASQEGASS